MIETYVDIVSTIRKLERLEGKISNPELLLGEIGDYLVGRILENYRRETDFENRQWAPLSSATIADKQRSGYPRAILVRTGKMKKSIDKTVAGKTLKITVAFPAQFHQRGTSKMPKRAILPEGKLTRKDERNIVDLAINYLEVT